MSDINGNPRKILLRGAPNYHEKLTGAIVSPGKFVQLTSTDTVILQATAAGFGDVLIAVEDALALGASIDTDYASGALASLHACAMGDEVNAMLKAGQNVAEGDLLIWDGAGKLIKNGQQASGVTVKKVVAVALAALNLSASGAVDTRLAVRIC